MPLNSEGQDKLRWKPTRNKNFKVSEYYLSLSSTLDNSFPWKPVWRSKVPPRVAFFSWTVSLGKILTTENLWCKGVAVVDWCLLLMNYGLWCGLYLIFNGICCMVSLIYSRVGKVPSVGIGALIYGGLSHIVSYGVFGENGTQDVLKGRNSLFQNLNLFFFTPC